MTREPICCEPGDPVTRAADLMRQHDIGSLPVVESNLDRRLVGIVTDRDLVVKVVGRPLGGECNGSGCDDSQSLELRR
jgi:CBS domain-containing protein